jgi:hypothetical protein
MNKRTMPVILGETELQELLLRCWMTHDGTWVETLGVEFEIDPQIKGCMMHDKGYCSA